MTNSIEARAKAEVQKHLTFLSPISSKSNPTTAGANPDDSHDSDEENISSDNDDEPQIPDPKNFDDFEYMSELVNLPPTT